MTVRAKFRCNTVEQATNEPVPVKVWNGNALVSTDEMTWPRTYRFAPQYDPAVPEDQRYAKASPMGELRIQIDNPLVSFRPGQDYYLDFTLVPEPTAAA